MFQSKSFASGNLTHLDNRVRCLLAHVVDSILISQPVTALDRVVHVPSPVILGHVTQSSIDTTLGGDSVRTSGEELGNACCLESGLGETEGRSKTSATGTAVKKGQCQTPFSAGLS